MPGCWLKKGVNEIIVLDLKGPEKAMVKGLKKPILDVLREKAPETHRKEGEHLNLSAETPVIKVLSFRVTAGRRYSFAIR